MQNFLWSCWAGGSWTIRLVPSPLCMMKIIGKLKMRILLIISIVRLVWRVNWYIKAVSPSFWMIIFILITWMVAIVLFLRKRNRTFITLVYLQSKQRDDRTDQEESVDASLHLRHSVAIPYPTPQKSLTMQVTGLLSKGTTSSCSSTMKWPLPLPPAAENQYPVFC